MRSHFLLCRQQVSTASAWRHTSVIFLQRIFRIFERLHGRDSYAGTGIGLAIVQKAVARMNGRVGVESELGSGSKFWVELPIHSGEEMTEPADA